MDLIRGDGGQMEPVGRPIGRKILLPYEIQICESLGIEPDEYFEYFDLLQQAKQERNAAFDHIPNVVNEPVSTTAIILAVVGTALSVASALLAPKPTAPKQSPKRPADFRGDDVRGRTKYSPLRQFDTVQQLATLSEIIPLVYTRKTEDFGGVRAESQLLWSQIKNKHTYQIIKVLLLFSGGEVELRPEFDSYAFGSQKIQSYGRSRIDISFAYGTSKQGPLLRNPDQDSGKPIDYPEGTFQDEDSQREYFTLFNNGADGRAAGTYLDFCGVQTPSTSAQFGQYAPMANGTAYRYPFQWPGKGDGEDDETKRRIFNTRVKHVNMYFWLGSAIEWVGIEKFRLRLQSEEMNYGMSGGTLNALSPDIRQADHFDEEYILRAGEIAYDTSDFAEKSNGFGSGISAADENCEAIDSAITVGDLFLLGDLVVKCTGINRNEPWETQNRFEKIYTFEFEDSYSKYSIFDNETRKKHIDTDYKHNHGKRPVYRTDYAYPLQRVSIGAVSTTREVDAVEIGLKSIVWRRLNGFPNANQHPNTQKIDDLAKMGSKFELGTLDRYLPRMSFFRVEYRDTKRDKDEWIDICPGHPFVVKGGTPQGEYSAIKIYHNRRGQFEYRFIPVSGNCFTQDEYAKPISIDCNQLNGTKAFTEAVNSASGLSVFFRGVRMKLDNSNTNSRDYVIKTWQQASSDTVNFARNQISNDVICDMTTFDAEDFSHRNDPEHEIVYLNEMKKNEDDWYTENGKKKQYSNLCYAGMTIAATRDFSNLSDVSAYFTKGIRVERLTETTGGDFDTEYLPGRLDRDDYSATNLFPEIAYDLLTSKSRGAGELVGRGEIHEGRMRRAARFCEANGFYWDGVISSEENIRDFIYQQAIFCLCDFTIIGGMFALVPTVPHFTRQTTSDLNKLHKIDHAASISNGRLTVKALFTDGNMRDYKVTFLASAERENFVAEVKYREEKLNGFPEMKSFRIRLAKLQNDDRNEFTQNDTVEVFDMTQFCTNRQHAIDFAKFALQVREKVDHAIVFETTPDCITQLAPGDYIRVASTITHNSVSSRINVGCISTSGVVQSAKTLSGTNKAYYWKPGDPAVREGQFTVGDNGKVTDSVFHGSLFSLKASSIDEPKIYKVESISLTEDGMVEVAGSYQPLTKDGRLKVLDWDDANFVLSE